MRIYPAFGGANWFTSYNAWDAADSDFMSLLKGIDEESEPGAVEEHLPFHGRISLGNMTEYTVGMFRPKPTVLFVGIEYRGAYTFENWAHWNYVREKLNLQEADARNMADLINFINNHRDRSAQGRYQAEVCS